MKKIFVIVALGLIGMTANAGQRQPLWTCALHFHGVSKGAQIIVGKFKTVAKGEMDCIGLTGKTYHQDVKVTLGGDPVALNVGLGKFELCGAALNIHLFAGRPEHLFGDYLAANGQAAVLGGAGAFTAVRLAPPQLAMSVSIQLLHGLGIQAGINSMNISAL